jgi:hypothetical protein
MDTLRIRSFADHNERSFAVVKHGPSGILVLQDQESGVRWHFDAPLSVVPLLSQAIRDRGLPNAVGLVISGHMAGETATMRWNVK